MANVYVGFRYVPLFCGVWDNSKGYEALSVVTHNGGGYTSNKPVPAGIEPGTDNGEYWAYTYRAGGEASAIDWDNVQNKPSTYPTTWEKVDGLTAKLETIGDSLNSINNALNSYDGEFSALEEELTSINNAVSILSTNLSTLETTVAGKANTDLSNVSNEDFSTKAAAAGVGGGNDKMNSPTNNGSSTSYFLRWSNANQGTWATLPTASESQAGTMSSAHYKQVNNTKRYVSIEGKNGIFNFRYWSDGFVELWAKVEISNLSVSTSLGNMYRSNSPITDKQYLYPYTFYPQPFVYAQFFTSNNASALVWLNPTWGKATQYLPPFYLVRPTSSTCSGYVYYYICGDT